MPMTRVRKLVGGSAWSVGGQVVCQAIGFAVLMLLARHLDARAFGTVAIVVLLLDLTRDVMLAGLPDYLIRKPEWDSSLASGAFWFQLALASVLGLTAVCIGFVLQLNGLAEIGGASMALAPVYLLEAAAAIPQARLRHELRFAPITLASVVGAITGGIAAVWVVLDGGGFWALVVGRLVGAGASTVITLAASRWRLTIPTLTGVGPALRFSAKLAGGRVLGAANVKATDLIVGFIGGPALLGAYQIAARPLNLVLQMLLAQFQQIALSALSPLSIGRQFERTVLDMLGVMALVVFPVAAGIAATSPELIVLAFGEKWGMLGLPTAILMLACIPATISYILSPVLVKVDRAGTLLNFTVVLTVIGIIMATFAASQGLIFVALAFLSRTTIGAAIAMNLLRRYGGVTPRSILSRLWRPLLGAVAILVGVTAVRSWLPPMPAITQAISLVSAGVAIYLAVLMPELLRHRRRLGDFSVSRSA